MRVSNGNASQILIISPEPWDGHFVSKHHYAVTLAARGYAVYFLDPPDVSARDIEVKKTPYENLWQVSAPKVAMGLRFYPAFLRRWVESRWLVRLEKMVGSAFTAVWLFENSRFFDMAFAADRLKIYHQVDSNQNFHMKEAASSASICFCITDFIKRDLMPFNELVYKIQHGVSQKNASALSEEQKNLFTINTTNSVTIGNLDIKFLDIDLLKSLIKMFPEITFHLVGNYSSDKPLFKSCKNLKNIIWWGKVESNLIPSILSECDIQLLLYKAKNQIDKEQLANSHKIMEYLASGKVTVATYTDEYKDKPGLLEMVEEPQEFIARFETVVTNLEYYNGITKQEERKRFARDNTYPKQLDRIIMFLNKNHLKL